MAQAFWQPVPILLLFSCLASFAWGMRYCFLQPGGVISGRRVTAALGTVFAIQQLAVLALARNSRPPEGSTAALLCAGSLGLFLCAIRLIRTLPLSAVFFPGSPVHLLENGHHRFVRQPFHASYLITGAGAVAAVSEWWPLLGVAQMFALCWRAAKGEERDFVESIPAEPHSVNESGTGMLAPYLSNLIRNANSTEKTRRSQAVGAVR